MAAQPSLLAWLPYENANELVVRMAKDILPAVKETPCIAGIGAHDPRLNIEKFIDELLEMGFCGFTNEPFVGIYGSEFGAQLEAAGLGFSKEVELIKICHERDLFTVGWAFTADEGRRMAGSRCRCDRSHCRGYCRWVNRRIARLKNWNMPPPKYRKSVRPQKLSTLISWSSPMAGYLKM